jgi:hypothetical protein
MLLAVVPLIAVSWILPLRARQVVVETENAHVK